MHTLRVISLAALTALGCGEPLPSATTESATGSSALRFPIPPPGCQPASSTPLYAQPADDSIAFGSLLEGAGHGTSTNSNWLDLAAGNFCGGTEKELVLISGASSTFSILRGPTPYAVGTFDDDQNPSWRAMAAGDLNADAYDEIVAVGTATAGAPDVVIMTVDPLNCSSHRVVQAAFVGTESKSDWRDVAIGNFDGSGKKIALLKTTGFALLSAGLTVEWSSSLDSNATLPWKGLAAGDLDGDGVDELVATRKVGDGRNATVIVYKWLRGSFRPIATSSFGNTGNSDWSGVTVGDFNGDGRAAIVLTKKSHSNFALLELPSAAVRLRVLATTDLESDTGQDWRGVAAVDWLQGDGAAELVMLRTPVAPLRADLFVYGDPFHRAARDSGLAAQKGSWDMPSADARQLLNGVREAHTNTVAFPLVADGDYERLVAFLQETQKPEGCVDGRRVRVSVTVGPKSTDFDPNTCYAIEQDSAATTGWNELDFLKPDAGGTHADACLNFTGWARLFGRLAQDYPNLVSFGVDDMFNHLDDFTPERVAEMQSLARQQAPWLSFVPIAYWGKIKNAPRDMGRTIDNVVFYFRNESVAECVADACGAVASVPNVVSEIADVIAFLPPGRKINVGMYWGSKNGVPTSTRYNYDLGRFLRNLPQVDSVTMYPMQLKPSQADCSELHFLDEQADGYRFCTAERVFGMTPHPVTDVDLTSLSGAPLAAGSPATYVFAAHGLQNIIYRAADNHAHELWRTSTGIGHSDLSALASSPNVMGDPMGYVFAAHDEQTVVYRGTDAKIHGLSWSWGGVYHDNLTDEASAPLAAGNPFGYVFDAIGFQNVLYRGSDGHLHGLYWSTGQVRDDDLSLLAGAPGPAATSTPFGYVFSAGGMQNAQYVDTQGTLHGLYWNVGEVRDDRLTSQAAAPPATGSTTAFLATTYGQQYAVYRGTDAHLHGLYWSVGPVGHDDLTAASRALSPSSDPTGYFGAADGSYHVVYRGEDNHVHSLWWKTGVVTHDDLTALSGGPLATLNPSAYLAPDGTQHVIYRSGDGHLHELLIRP